MKRTINLFAAALCMAGAMMTMTSCDLYERIFKKGDSGSSSVSKEAVLPQDRESIESAKRAATYTPQEFKRGIIKGDWAVEEVMGKKAIGETAPYFKFSQEDGRMYGNNGCNVLNASYKYNPADSTLSFSNMAVTMMYCQKEGITDYLINQAVNDTRYYNLQEATDGYELILLNEDHKPVMTLTHQNLDFLNGTWKVVAIGDEQVHIDKMKLVFDIDEGKVHGNTGCNVLNGRLETDMDTPNTFSFEAIAVTMMMCPQMEYQTAMLVALEEACRAKPLKANMVQLLDSDGDPVITLERTSDK
ncbi:MAG: META domain-containing protein [Muribaculaceae bacterium]|nr:META domain-containing protein [Muribaculaceae bacterium]